MVGVRVASAGGIDGVGTVSCTFTGSAKIKPALITGGTAAPVTTKLKGALTNCTGTGDGAGVTSGKVKGLIVSMGNNDCGGLAVNGLAGFTATIKWKGSTKLNATTVTFAASPAGNINLAGPNLSIQITLNGAVGATGGSFSGNTVSSLATTDQKITDFATACGAKGVKAFTFTNILGPSTLALN